MQIFYVYLIVKLACFCRVFKYVIVLLLFLLSIYVLIRLKQDRLKVSISSCFSLKMVSRIVMELNYKVDNTKTRVFEEIFNSFIVQIEKKYGSVKTCKNRLQRRVDNLKRVILRRKSLNKERLRNRPFLYMLYEKMNVFFIYKNVISSFYVLQKGYKNIIKTQYLYVYSCTFFEKIVDKETECKSLLSYYFNFSYLSRSPPLKL